MLHAISVYLASILIICAVVVTVLWVTGPEQ